MKQIKKALPAILVHMELILMSLVVLIPIFWIFRSSLNEGSTLASSKLFSGKISFKNYLDLFTRTNYLQWFWNTFKIAFLNMCISVFVIMLTSWILSRFDFRGRKFGLMTMLLLSIFPTFLSMTALYTLFLTLGLLDKPVALVIIYTAGAIPYNTWLVKGYLDGLSKSLDEASYIDGCTHFKTFFKIILPLSMPIITYVAVSQFMLPWMDYILPNILLSADKSKTLAVGLFTMISGKENANFTMFAAGAVCIAVPITLMFFIFQRYLVEGVSAGANKE